MSLTNRNNRSIHGDAKKIKADLADHGKRMAEYTARGFCNLHASSRAYADMRAVPYVTRNGDATCSECKHFEFHPEVGGWVR